MELSPVRKLEMLVKLFPLPTERVPVRLTKLPELVPHSNQVSVEAPLGLTSPRMLAEPVVMFVAESTLTEGKSLAESLKVSKLLMSPLTVPKEFLAIALK